ncbi:hypothetical protein A3H40_02535 [Candidatus Daviesbacteria bacterium RIFCSPLOWO2_02_FULL_38_15]|uniref:Glycosyltransferase RgtA/B/C/D-like domain-containing protein n=1 Tax=Candidatus Daviesbacteria bacterium RIFCSPLOWO2_02_FULL_38_15 TaxID=1797794 RepID=A0A1F5N3U0_9BACT|nr:MAG: hypothetical protein A3H40_02535 [Candidatus Daviesbacteria bacterium RIFCSPLOWO2_02_FULL_38_15]
MIWGILGVGLLLRLISLNQSLWFDEGINIMAARSFSFLGMLTQYAVADFHPPGWFAILWVWGKLFGYSETALRIPSVIFGTITIYMTYLIGRKLVSPKIGLLAALLLSINPLHIYYSQEARMYALAALAVTVNLYLLIRVIQGEKVNTILLVFSNFFILLSDYIAYFIFPAQLVFLLFLKRKEIVKKWAIGLTAAVILNFFWWPIFLKQLDIGATAFANLPTWKFVIGGFDFKTLPLTFIKIIIGRISLANKLIYAVLLLPVGSLFAYILWSGIKKLEGIPKKLLLSWIIVPLLIATIISLVIPIFSYFRVLYIVPGFLILLAVGTLSFKKRLRNGLLMTVILVELFCSLLYLLIPFNQREDWKGLVAFFKDIKPEIILLESSGTFPAFEYYAQGTLYVKGALKDFPAKDESSVSNLGDLLKDINETYLVDYLVQISDPNRLVAKKLTELGYKEKDIKNFNGVGFVYHYIRE